MCMHVSHSINEYRMSLFTDTDSGRHKKRDNRTMINSNCKDQMTFDWVNHDRRKVKLQWTKGRNYAILFFALTKNYSSLPSLWIVSSNIESRRPMWDWKKHRFFFIDFFLFACTLQILYYSKSNVWWWQKSDSTPLFFLTLFTMQSHLWHWNFPLQNIILCQQRRFVLFCFENIFRADESN